MTGSGDFLTSGCGRERWASVHLEKQVSWHCLENNRFLLSSGQCGRKSWTEEQRFSHRWAGRVGSAGPLCIVRRQVFWHPQSSRLLLSGGAGFCSLTGEQVLSSGWAQWGAQGLCALWRNRLPGATHRVVGYHFPPSVEKLGFLPFDERASGLLQAGVMGECWASVHCGEAGLMVPSSE